MGISERRICRVLVQHRSTQGPSHCGAKAFNRYYPMILLTAFSGLRLSEIRGLPWVALDLKKQMLRVYQRADRYGSIGRVKSAAGIRKIHLNRIVCDALAEWQKICPDSKYDLVFPNGKGNVETPKNIGDRCWHRAQELAGLVTVVTPKSGRRAAVLKHRFTFHSIRHFFASLRLSSGYTGKELMTEIGHSTIALTMDLYGHLFEDDDAGRNTRAEKSANDFMGGTTGVKKRGTTS